MSPRRALAAAAALWLAATGRPAAPHPADPNPGRLKAGPPETGRTDARLPASTLAVRDGGRWRVWWDAGRAPAAWDAGARATAGVERAVHWRPGEPGVEVGELALAGTGEARRLRVVLVRVDPRRTALHLHALVDPDGTVRPWRVDSAPGSAAVALNTGPFDDGGPWGWVVHRGRELRPPGRGPLAPAVVVDATGAVRLVPTDSIAAVRAAGAAREAFQSYPALLAGDGAVPAALRAPGRGVDVAHRDARLALGVAGDGRVLLALTRFDPLGGALGGALGAALGGVFGAAAGAVPLGPTAPEMAAVMGALGARRAVLLDGGISGQLLVRRAPGAEPRAWRGLRPVPLGLVVAARPAV